MSRMRLTTWLLLNRVQQEGTLDERTVYRVGDLRLVRSSDGKGFNLVVTCADCGRARVSRRQLARVDLGGAPAHDKCSTCLLKAMRPMDLGGVDMVLSQPGDGDDWLAAD